MHLPLSLKDDVFKPSLLKSEPAITETAVTEEPIVRICNGFQDVRPQYTPFSRSLVLKLRPYCKIMKKRI